MVDRGKTIGDAIKRFKCNRRGSLRSERQAHQQFDHFHLMQWLWYYLRNALIQFRKSLRGKRWEHHREELWELKWGLLKHMDRWTLKERLLILAPRGLRQTGYTGTRGVVALLVALTPKCVEFLCSEKVDRMVTYPRTRTFRASARPRH